MVQIGKNCRVFLLGQGIRWSPALAKNLLTFSLTTRKNSPLCRLPTNFYPPSTIYQFPWCNPVKTLFLAFTCCYCCPTILILTLYSLYIPVMLILISINVQCLQNVLFSFEKGSNSQDHSSSDSHNPIKIFLYSKICNCTNLGEFPPTPEHYLLKTWIAHLHHKTIFRKKWSRLELPFSTSRVLSC